MKILILSVLHEIEIEDSPALPRRRRVFSFSKKSILEFTANKNLTPSSSHISTPRTVASQNLNEENAATPVFHLNPFEDEVSERLRNSISADSDEPGMNYYSPLPDLVGDIGNVTPGGSVNPNTILRQRINSFDEQLRRFSVTSLENSLDMNQAKSLYERRVTRARLMENIDLSELDSPNSTRTIHRNFGKENSALEIDENIWNNYGEELKVLADNYALNYKVNNKLNLNITIYISKS